MVAIILAAGYATRLYPLTLNTPKALLEIGGKPMLDHIIDKLADVKAVTKTVIVSNDKFYGRFEEWLSSRTNGGGGGAGINNSGGRNGAGISNSGAINSAGIGNGNNNSGVGIGSTTNNYSNNSNYNNIVIINDGSVSEATRLGAIGDIKFAIDSQKIADDVIIIAGDNFFTFRLADLYAFYESVNSDCVVVKKMDSRNEMKGFGVAVISPDNQVLDFEEKPENPKSDFAVFATYIYRRDTLPLFSLYLGEGNPKDAPGNFPAWLCKRKFVSAYAFDGECYDIGTPDAYKTVCEKFK